MENLQTISQLTSEEEKTLRDIVSVLMKNGEGLDPLYDIWSANVVTMHLFAQQTAFFLSKQPNETFRENYLKNVFQRFSQLVAEYEKEVKTCPSNSSKT